MQRFRLFAIHLAAIAGAMLIAAFVATLVVEPGPTRGLLESEFDWLIPSALADSALSTAFFDNDGDGYCTTVTFVPVQSVAANGLPRGGTIDHAIPSATAPALQLDAVCANGFNDCDDASFEINPGAVEVCDLRNDNCNFEVDEFCDNACGFADSIVSIARGPGVDPSQMASQVIGAPDGFALPLGTGGTIVVALAGRLIDLAGPDLVVHENGVADGGLDENYGVEVSADGITFVSLGDCAGGTCSFDLAGHSLPEPSYVRITDLGPVEPGAAEPNMGADIDAIDPLHCAELCNRVDDDGDLDIDEGCNDDQDPYCDTDFRVIGTLLLCPRGGGDCLDGLDTVYPGREEDCHDGFDNDCNLVADSEDAACQGGPVCGDGRMDAGEECDDGNTQSADGCDSQCRVEPDTDGDGRPDVSDNCPTFSNPGWGDQDGDGRGDACDNCVKIANADQADIDLNGMGNRCDVKTPGAQLQVPVFWCAVAGSQAATAPDPTSVLEGRLRVVTERVHGLLANIELFSALALSKLEILGDLGPHAGNDNGVCDPGEDCGNELLGDGIGDDDGICEQAQGELGAGCDVARLPLFEIVGDRNADGTPRGNEDGRCDAGEACGSVVPVIPLPVATPGAADPDWDQQQQARDRCESLWSEHGYGGMGIVAVNWPSGSRFGRASLPPSPLCPALGQEHRRYRYLWVGPVAETAERDLSLAHEFGHTLSLQHGDGLDDDGDGRFDEDPCDDGASGCDQLREGTCRNPLSCLVQSGDRMIVCDRDVDGAPLDDGGYDDFHPKCLIPGDPYGKCNLMGRNYRPKDWSLTEDQVLAERRGACNIPGTRGCSESVRGGGFPVTGRSAFAALDNLRLEHVGAYVLGGENQVLLGMRIAYPHALTGEIKHLWFVDLDGRVDTGGNRADASSATGVTANIDGVDLIAELLVDPTGSNPNLTRVWTFSSTGFTTAADPGLVGSVGEDSYLREETDESSAMEFAASKLVTAVVPRALLPAIGLSARMEGVVECAASGERVDSGVGVALLGERVLPQCVVAPQVVRLGETVSVSAQDQNPGAVVDLWVGSQQFDSGIVESDGTVHLTAVIPLGQVPGLQTIAIKDRDTGATARCSVGLQSSPEFVSPPTPVDSSTIQVRTGHLLTIEVQSTDADAYDVLTLSASRIPLGATLQPVSPANPIVATLTWVPMESDLGQHAVSLRVADTQGLIDTRELGIDVLPNRVPVASAGADMVLECAGDGHAPARLDGTASSDPDSTPGTNDDIVSFEWIEDLGTTNQRTLGYGAVLDVSFGLGSHAVTLRVTDGGNASSTDEILVTVVDRTPPTLSAPSDITAECTGSGGTAVALGAAAATDTCCAEVTVSNDAPALFPIGASVVRWTATDCNGNSSHAEQSVTVVDTTPPEIVVTAAPRSLWPPNHRMVDVTAAVATQDLCSVPTVVLAAVTSSEPDDASGNGDGRTVDDIQSMSLGSADFTVGLRAEREGAGTGRTYTVSYVATDGAGNQTTASDVVAVPHDQSGTADPVSIETRDVLGTTLVVWSPVPGARWYNVVRGHLESLAEGVAEIDLGTVTCVEGQSVDESTTGWEDSEVPEPGRAFFYLVDFDDGKRSTYGAESVGKPRVAGLGDCGHP